MSEMGQMVINALISLVVLFLLTKLLGKKQVSEMTFFELIAAVAIGSIAGNMILVAESNIWGGIIAIILFGGIVFVTELMALKSKNFRDFTEGKGTVFIREGKILEDNLMKEKVSTDKLGSLLRKKNVFSIADVEFAVMEPTGDLSVLLKKEHRPLTPKDLQMKMPNEKVPQTVIMDGEILHDPLALSGKDRNWLETELSKLDVTLDNVFYGQIDSYGDLTVDLYDDMLKVPTPQTRPLLMAMLQKSQADLGLFSLATENEKAKNMYKSNAKKLQQAIDTLKPFLMN